MFEYYSEEELIHGVNKAFDLIEKLMPHFIEAVQKSVTAGI